MQAESVVRSAQKLAGRNLDVAAATSEMQRPAEAPEPALHPSQRSHRRDYAVLAEQYRTVVQGAIRLTFGRHEHDGTGRNVVLACRNKSNDRHIGGDMNFLFAAFIGHRHYLTVNGLNSMTGAALEVLSQIGIPAKFTLVVPGDELHLVCNIVWRSEYRIGVAFD